MPSSLFFPLCWPYTEEPGRLQYMGSQRIGLDECFRVSITKYHKLSWFSTTKFVLSWFGSLEVQNQGVSKAMFQDSG